MPSPIRTALAFVCGAAVLAGCGGSTNADTTISPPVPTLSATQTNARAATVERLEPAAFQKRMASTKGLVIDVHVPEPDEIPGTDHHIAYDAIVGDDRLPDDRATELLIYCRSGNMSATATQALLEDGYTQVVELIGGYNAWKESGRPMGPGT